MFYNNKVFNYLLKDLELCNQDNEQLVAELNAVDQDRQEDLAHNQGTIAELKLQMDNQKREITELTEALDKVT